MGAPLVNESIAVLERTPPTLDALLRGLPAVWTQADEGADTWSPYIVVAHLIHTENTNWMPRLETILEHGANKPFPPFDQSGQLRNPASTPLPELLDELSERRAESLVRLRALDLDEAALALYGTHPALGDVTLRQLLAAWTGHDLTHLAQIVRVIAKRYRNGVGPWSRFLSVMR